MAKVWKVAGITAAKLTGQSSSMDEAAGEVLEAAKSEARKHRDTGDYIKALVVENVRGRSGVRDRLVSATDPAAMSIEFGHATRRSKSHEGPPSWVPGKFIMINAANEVG